jgi:hypothetical protein
MTLEFTGNKFIAGDCFLIGVDSIHYKSETDSLYRYLWCEKNYENPLVIQFDGGHRPVKILTKDKLRKSADFFIKQFKVKYGSNH